MKKTLFFLTAFCFAAMLFVACEKDAMDTTNVVGSVYFISNNTNDSISVTGSYDYTISSGNTSWGSSINFNKKIGSRQTYLITKNKSLDLGGNNAINALYIYSSAGQELYIPNNNGNYYYRGWENLKYWDKTLNSSKDTAYYRLTIY